MGDEIVYLTDITGTLGQWLDAEFSDEIPQEVIHALSTAYQLAVKALD